METTAMRTTPGIVSAALPLAIALALPLGGCAQVVGIEEFTVESGSSSGTGVVDPCTEVHGCSRSAAIDRTGVGGDTVFVAFDMKEYDPPCIRIRNGMKVNFNSKDGVLTFDDVPIAGGTFPEEDPESPIQNPSPPDVIQATFQFTGACAFPYFSPLDAEKMQGVIFVGGP